MPRSALSVGVAKYAPRPEVAAKFVVEGVVEEILPLPHATLVRPRFRDGPGAGRLEVVSTRAVLDEANVTVGSNVRVGLPPRALHLLSAGDEPSYSA